MTARCVVALVVVCGVLAPSPAGAAPPVPQHRCGSFFSAGEDSEGRSYRYRFTVFNSDGLSCGLAMAVIEAFWDPNEPRHHHGGSFQYNSWYTIDAFPTWRCALATGGGACRHKDKVAGYEVVYEPVAATRTAR